MLAMKQRSVSLIILAAAITVFGAGCETVAQGYNNLVHGPQTAALPTETTIQYAGNVGTMSTVEITPQTVEQAIGGNLGAQVESLRHSILTRDKKRADGRAKGLLAACDKAEKELKGNNSLKAAYIKDAIFMIRRAVPTRDTKGLGEAATILGKVRGA